MKEYLELVKESFTSEHEKKARNYPYVAYSIKDRAVMYTIVPRENGGVITCKVLKKADVSNCTYEKIDIGLRTEDGKRILVADRNLGATSPEDPGAFFAWGELQGYKIVDAQLTMSELVTILSDMNQEPATEEDVQNILQDPNMVAQIIPLLDMLAYSQDREFDQANYKWWDEETQSYTKYNTTSQTTLELSDDAAHVYIGEGWQVPSSAVLDQILNTCQVQSFDGNMCVLSSPSGELLKLPFYGSYIGEQLENDIKLGRYNMQGLAAINGQYSTYYMTGLWSNQITSGHTEPTALTWQTVDGEDFKTTVYQSKFIGYHIRPVFIED